MIFKYELRFVAFTWPNLCLLDLSLLFIVLVGRNFVSDMCKLKPKKPKNLFFVKKSKFFFQPCRQVMMRKWDHLTKTLGRSLRSHQTEYAAYRSLSNMPTGRLVDCSSISLQLNTTKHSHTAVYFCVKILQCNLDALIALIALITYMLLGRLTASVLMLMSVCSTA